MKIATCKAATLAVMSLIFCFSLFGCGGDGGGGAPAATVSGVAATGAPMSGVAFLKDAASNQEVSTAINAQTGAFSFNVSGQTAPFMLRAGSLYSMSGGPGTANINPLTNVMVAEMAGFSNMSSMNTFYRNPDPTRMSAMFNAMSTARLHLRQTLNPLLTTYGVPNADPMFGQFIIGQGMDRMFDDVKMAIGPTGLIMMQYGNGNPVYTGPMGNMASGTMMPGNIVLPGTSGTTPGTSGITITPSIAKLPVSGTQQFSANIPVTWSVTTPSGGSITAGGLYTAPTVQGMFLVKATSIADANKSTTATIMVGHMGMQM